MNTLVRSAIVLCALVVSGVLGSASAIAAELSDYRWERRPLLVFAPADNDPRLVDTVGRIEASRCDFVARDMVVGVLVANGRRTLDGQAVGADQSRRLRDQFAIGESAFAVVLIGKDGGEKYRVTDVPDLKRIFSVIDGMPMRSRDKGAAPNSC